jgi:hypothetical protein
MNDRELAQALSLLRLTAGFVLFVAPRRALKVWLGDADPSPTAVTAARSAGIRDAAIGIGALVALDRETEVRGWLEAGAMVDAADALGVLAGWRHMSPLRRTFFLLTASGAALLGTHLAAALD